LLRHKEKFIPLTKRIV